MLYLLWALLNIGLFILLLIKGASYFKKNYGSVASIIFVVGLFVFVGRGNSDQENKNANSTQLKTWEFIPPDSLDKGSNDFLDIDLEDNLISKYSLGISYGKDKQLVNNIPSSANTWTTGFSSGTSWKPLSIIVNRTNDNNKFKYEVYGVVSWTLVGVKLYSQVKTWAGFAVIK